MILGILTLRIISSYTVNCQKFLHYFKSCKFKVSSAFIFRHILSFLLRSLEKYFYEDIMLFKKFLI